ncbi:MAG: cytochrome c [Burkholderiales bacterium]|nr:cytochrome c [Burkholderiales bacterium]
MNRHLVPAVSALAVIVTFSAAAAAQEMKPDRAIKYRQGILQAMGWNMGVLGAMVKGEIPYDKDKAVRSATFIGELAQMPFDGFVPGSETGAPTKAKPDIWKERAKFDKLAQAMQAETLKLVAAAKTGDVAQLRTAAGATGKACSNCHDDFRNK